MLEGVLVLLCLSYICRHVTTKLSNDLDGKILSNVIALITSNQLIVQPNKKSHLGIRSFSDWGSIMVRLCILIFKVFKSL